MSELILFLIGICVGFGLGMFAGCMLSFAKTQEADYPGDEHEQGY